MSKVQIQCLKCQHTAIREVADSVSIARLSRKLVCSECGSKAMLAQRIVGTERPVKHG
jgi:DNA-directed RNA polymerase subunit RPC12/RpoP